MTETRPCARCGDQRHWTGTRWRCSVCFNNWQTERRKRLTPEQRARDAEVQAATRRAWSPEQRAIAYARVAKWREANPDRYLQGARDWYAANAVRARAAKTAEYRRDPEPFLARNMLRKARLLDAVCKHGPKCVDQAFLSAVRSADCTYCREPASDADHFEPLARGGLHCRENIVPACAPCNGSKKDRDPAEWLASRGLLA